MAAVTPETERTLWEAWALFDTYMSDDPTCSVYKEDPEKRVRAITAVYGEHLKGEWLRLRNALGAK